jgi:hypothetical protein
LTKANFVGSEEIDSFTPVAAPCVFDPCYNIFVKTAAGLAKRTARAAHSESRSSSRSPSVCLKCLEIEPAQRYASAEEVAQEPRRFLQGETVAVRPVGWYGRAGCWSVRHPAKAGFIAALALLLATLCVVPSAAYFKVCRAELARGLETVLGWRLPPLRAKSSYGGSVS